MSTNKNTTYLNLDHDFRVETVAAGGFILSQSYYESTEKDEEGREIFYNYKKAFSNATDLLHFLEESFGYPLPRATGAVQYTPATNVHPLPT